MPDQLQLRGGTTVQHSSFTGASKEVTVDTTKKTVVVHDGSTAGGNPMMREDASNSALALGSQGTPSLKFTGDLNTGIYSPGADQVAISTGGSGRLFVDANGNVGVGVASPGGSSADRQFTLTGSSTSQISINAGSVLTNFGSTSSICYIQVPGAYPLIFYTNNQERLRITSAGLVGVGTSSPSGTLEVGAVAGAVTAGDLIVSTGSTAASVTVGRISSTSADSTTFRVRNRVNSTVFVVDGPTERVGIGTQSPSSFLHVKGGNNNVANIDNNGSQFTNLGFSNNGTEKSAIYWDNTSGVFVIGPNAASSQLLFRANNDERARIDSSGRLLVGTSSNLSGSPLQVAASTPVITVAQSNQTVNQDMLMGAFNVYSNDSSTTSSGGIGGIRMYAATAYNTSHTPSYLSFHTHGESPNNGTEFGNTTERMRIQSTGRILQGSTSSNGGGGGIECTSINATSHALIVNQTEETAGTTYKLISAYRGVFGVTAVESFVVYNNGNVQNTNNSYTGISDIKLKENIVDASSQWDDIKSLQVRNYNLKEGQTHKQIGLIAQEVEPVSPGLVYESPDCDDEGNDLGTVTKSVNYSVLYMKAVKALQEAMERIEQLEAEMVAVKAQLS